MITKIFALLRTNFIMLTRQRSLILTSLGLAVISMLVFGFLFGGNNASKTRLGVVDQDSTSISAQIVQQLRQSNALQVFTGSSSEEQQALKDGDRDAVIVMPAGFSQQLVRGGAHLQVYYDQSNPITAASAQLTVKAIVDGINSRITHQPGPVTLDQQAVVAKELREIDFITPGMPSMPGVMKSISRSSLATTACWSSVTGPGWCVILLLIPSTTALTVSWAEAAVMGLLWS